MKLFFKSTLIALLTLTSISAYSQRTSTFDADKFEYALSEDKKPQILDVRTKKEFEKDHLKGAKNIDINSIDFDKRVLKKFKKDRIIYVYCRSGVRSLRAAKILENLDFKIIYNLQGGIVEWQKKGKPIKKIKDKGNL